MMSRDLEPGASWDGLSVNARSAACRNDDDAIARQSPPV